jgi:elongation factor P--beta-lysine ligase
MTTEKIVSIRLEAAAVRALRQLAHQHSLREKTDLTWADLVRSLIAKEIQNAQKETN